MHLKFFLFLHSIVGMKRWSGRWQSLCLHLNLICMGAPIDRARRLFVIAFKAEVVKDIISHDLGKICGLTHCCGDIQPTHSARLWRRLIFTHRQILLCSWWICFCFVYCVCCAYDMIFVYCRNISCFLRTLPIKASLNKWYMKNLCNLEWNRVDKPIYVHVWKLPTYLVFCCLVRHKYVLTD